MKITFKTTSGRLKGQALCGWIEIKQYDLLKEQLISANTTNYSLRKQSIAWEERYNLLTNEFIKVNDMLDRAESDLVEALQRYNTQLERNDKLVDELVVADEQMAGVKEELRTAKVQFVKIKSTLTYTTYWEDRLDKAKNELKASNDTLNNWRASALAYREVLNDTKKELTAAKGHLETWKQAAKSHREIQYKLRDELKENNEQLSRTCDDLGIIKRQRNVLREELKVSRQVTRIQYDETRSLKGQLTHTHEVEDALREELRLASELLEMIPERPLHGVPHAMKWVLIYRV